MYKEVKIIIESSVLQGTSKVCHHDT